MSDLPAQLGHIAWFIVLPLMLLIGLGFVLQRRLGLDLPTLTRLNFYVVVPGMVYTAVVESPLTLGSVGVVVAFTLAFMALAAVGVVGLAWLRGVPRDRWSPLAMTGIFYNAGNYGLPLQQLAFRPVGQGDAAMGLQVFVMLVQNITSFTLGVVMAASGGQTAPGLRGARLRENLGHMLRLPPLYALAAVGVTVLVRRALGDNAPAVAYALTPFMDALHYAQGGFVVVALVTTGAQLATVKPGGAAYPVTLSVVFRLLIAPALALGLIWLMGLDGLTAQVLLISSATPVSVNCMLICLEFDNHPDFLARSVFYSTLLSPVTVTGVILLGRSGLI